MGGDGVGLEEEAGVDGAHFVERENEVGDLVGMEFDVPLKVEDAVVDDVFEIGDGVGVEAVGGEDFGGEVGVSEQGVVHLCVEAGFPGILGLFCGVADDVFAEPVSAEVDEVLELAEAAPR